VTPSPAPRPRAAVLADLARAERAHLSAFDRWLAASDVDHPRAVLDVANAAHAREMFRAELARMGEP